MSELPILVVSSEHAGIRLDKWLAQELPELSRSRVQQLVEKGHVTRSGETISNAAYKVKAEEAYQLTIPEVVPLDLKPIKMDLNIVHEDDDLLVINKPPGISVHPSDTSNEPTLVHGLLAHCGDSLSGIGGVARPGIVHRIDKDTSGLLVVAKHDQAHQHLSNQLKDRSLSRIYTALCWGVPKDMEGTIDAPIGRSPKNRKKMAVLKAGGKEARTHYKIKNIFSMNLKREIEPFACEVQCSLESGRTHQIRVHMTHFGHALIGDPLYGSPRANTLSKLETESQLRQSLEQFDRQALHAHQLKLIHPATEEEKTFIADLPNDMNSLIKRLQSG